MAIVAVGGMDAAEAKKPKIMVFPSDDWCMRKGYMLDEKTPDYEKALQDVDMDGAVAVMGDVMAEMGYQMFSLKQELKQLHTEDAYSMAVTSKGDGMVTESDRDILTRNVGADFIVELALDNKPFGARRSIEFKAQTIDAASRKILHGDIGTSSASSAPVPEGMYEWTIPAASWAVFSGNGPLPGAMQDLQRRIITEYLPDSGYELDKAPDIEVYLDQPGEESRFQVWLPVTKP